MAVDISTIISSSHSPSGLSNLLCSHNDKRNAELFAPDYKPSPGVM
jgi:hypothetical protein